MKRTGIILALFFSGSLLYAQKKTTTSAVVSFDATTSLDPLPKAENKTAVGSVDIGTGAVAFEVAIKNFSFQNPKMQGHFNGTTWMDSDQFPTATFKGKITNLPQVNLKVNGTYNANVEGALTMHGVTNQVTTTAVITVDGKKLNAKAEFSIKMKDYQINGPAIGSGHVSSEPVIKVLADLK